MGTRRGREGRGRPCATPARYRALLVALVVLAAAALVAGVSIGAVTVPPGTVWRVLGDRLHLGGRAADPVAEQIVWDVRVPRALLGFLTGAALAMAGTAIQAVARNPLGDPYILGIVPGASLGAVVVIVLGADVLGGVSLGAAAFCGGLVAFAATFALSRQGGRWPPARLVLAGVAVGYLFSAATFYLQTRAAPNQVQRVLFWSLGSVAGARWDQLGLPAVVLVAAGAWLVVQGRRLNALVLGDDAAAALGLAVGRFQLHLMAVSALLAAVVVTVAGGVGFVGLMVPHIARLLVGADHRRVLPVAAIAGGVFLVGVDVLARVVSRPTEVPLGVVTAAFGSPFLLGLLRAQRPASGSPGA